MTEPDIKASYEAVPYPRLCHAHTHPDRLATVATLLGLRPGPVDACRVLELGAAAGGNLVPMAYALPRSTFYGLDLAPGQIAAARQWAEALGLTNIRFQAGDLRDIDPDLGQFDYIIAHGVYSWTPPQVRDALLAACRRHLAPQGVAFVSYNVLPGWYPLLGLRDMMLYHSREAPTLAERVRPARDLIDRLADIIPPDEVAGAAVRHYLDILERRGAGADALLVHDELAEVNDPVYFHQFAAHAARHGLQYLAEAEFSTVMLSQFPAATRRQLADMAGTDLIALEQYIDFVRQRTLRQTLLVHREANVNRRLRPDPALMAQFAAVSWARPALETVDLAPGVVSEFVVEKTGQLRTDHPVSKAALLILREAAPQAIPFSDLLRLAQRQIYRAESEARAASEADAQMLAVTLLQGYTHSSELLELHVYQAPFTTAVSQRPRVSRLARDQARAGESRVVNLRHERVQLDPLTRHLLPRLDGQTGLAPLVDELQAMMGGGELMLKASQELSGPGEIQATLERDLERILAWLGQAALLEA